MGNESVCNCFWRVFGSPKRCLTGPFGYKYTSCYYSARLWLMHVVSFCSHGNSDKDSQCLRHVVCNPGNFVPLCLFGFGDYSLEFYSCQERLESSVSSTDTCFHQYDIRKFVSNLSKAHWFSPSSTVLWCWAPVLFPLMTCCEKLHYVYLHSWL